MSDLIMVGQSAQVLIGEIARLQALLKAHRDMLMRLYQDTVWASVAAVLTPCAPLGVWSKPHLDSGQWTRRGRRE